MTRLEHTTIRDYGGGWNVSDSDLNLSSKFQPVSENISRGVDGSFYPRMGTFLHSNFATGDFLGTARLGFYFLMETVEGSPKIRVTIDESRPDIPFTSGAHIKINSISSFGGFTHEELIGTYGVIVENNRTFYFYANTNAISTSSQQVPASCTFDTYILAGNIIHNQYFNRRLLVFTDIGEIGSVDEQGNMSRIWGILEAQNLADGLVPTRACNHWSSDAFKSTVIACNGFDKDKPVQIDANFKVEFLVDKGNGSNAAVPKADYVVCMQGFVIFIRTEFGDPFVEFSARGTDGTFTRDPNPADSVEADLSMITSTVESVLLGAAPIRDKLYAAFYDKGMIGSLGVYDDNGAHNPDFTDTVAEHGTISHRTMVSLGNDIFMCDYAGIPSLSISQQSGIFIPVRLSELIAPEIQKHLSSIDEDILRQKAFAVFNPTDRTYMLFLPVYSDRQEFLSSDPILFNKELKELNRALIRIPNHRLFEDTSIQIHGSDDIGDLNKSLINGTRKVVAIVDKDNVIVQLGGAPSSSEATYGGGDDIYIRPINNETFVYAFEYNKEFRIRRWTRYRGWNFDCACASQRGKVFMCKGLKVFRMGDNETPAYADAIGEFDQDTWGKYFSYQPNFRVKDQTNGLIYLSKKQITPSNYDTFAEYRDAFPEDWEEYNGWPIKWVLETPWSDMTQRGRQKIVSYISLDTEGFDTFTVSAFVNRIRQNRVTYELTPYRQLKMQAGDVGGWGIQSPGGWGSGRRTRDEKLWAFGIRGKLLRWRYEGKTTKRVRIISHTMFYKMGNIR